MQLSNDLPEGWRHIHLAETDSLMLALKREETAAEGVDFVLATADFQTVGRGQRGGVPHVLKLGHRLWPQGEDSLSPERHRRLQGHVSGGAGAVSCRVKSAGR